MRTVALDGELWCAWTDEEWHGRTGKIECADSGGRRKALRCQRRTCVVVGDVNWGLTVTRAGWKPG